MRAIEEQEEAGAGICGNVGGGGGGEGDNGGGAAAAVCGGDAGAGGEEGVREWAAGVKAWRAWARTGAAARTAAARTPASLSPAPASHSRACSTGQVGKLGTAIRACGGDDDWGGDCAGVADVEVWLELSCPSSGGCLCCCSC